MQRDYDYQGFLRDLAAAKVRIDPAPKDRPNAALPAELTIGDPVIGNDARGPGRPKARVFESRHMAGMTLHSAKGAMPVDGMGRVRCAASDHETATWLMGIGFKECQPGEPETMKALTDLHRQGQAKAQVMTMTTKLSRAAAALASPDVGVWLRRRAEENEGRR
jgi:hypothetical protein